MGNILAIGRTRRRSEAEDLEWTQVRNRLRDCRQHETAELELRACGLRRLPREFRDLHQLQSLTLWNCQNLDRLPSFSSFPNLQELTIHACTKLDKLPNTIGKLPLRKLILEYVPLKVLPPTIGDLRMLQELKISRTYLQMLPDTICGLTSLEVLVIHQFPDHRVKGLTRLTVLPQTVALRALTISGTLLERLPDTICGFTTLEVLEIHDNYVLECLPANLGNLKQLKRLSVMSNAVSSVPESVGNLEQLEELLIGDSLCEPLSLLNFGKLKNLRWLHVRLRTGDLLSELPQGLGQLNKLYRLEKWGGSRRDWDHIESIVLPPRLRTFVAHGLEDWLSERPDVVSRFLSHNKYLCNMRRSDSGRRADSDHIHRLLCLNQLGPILPKGDLSPIPERELATVLSNINVLLEDDVSGNATAVYRILQSQPPFSC